MESFLVSLQDNVVEDQEEYVWGRARGIKISENLTRRDISCTYTRSWDMTGKGVWKYPTSWYIMIAVFSSSSEGAGGLWTYRHRKRFLAWTLGLVGTYGINAFLVSY